MYNKIEAKDKTIFEVLGGKKYNIDYFQREYSWERQHVEQLVDDLTSAFLNEYQPTHSRSMIERYDNYFLGPFVLSDNNNGNKSIIDGQQRLTTLTLLLIYLNRLQQEYKLNEQIESMIFSERYGVKSFNISVPDRVNCLQYLFDSGTYTITESDNESTKNLVARYDDIVEIFTSEITSNILPYFIDWLKEKVVFVEISTSSDESAYTIFETMNDRGQNLTATEMLKSYILSNYSNEDIRIQANDFWKQSIQTLHSFSSDEDQRFFKSWFRAQYAETIRSGGAGAENKDFEKIANKFHSWFRDNIRSIGLASDNEDSFSKFINNDFKFFYNAYLKVKHSEANLTIGLEYVYYIQYISIPSALSYPMLLAPLIITDSMSVVERKINLVAKYLEIYGILGALYGKGKKNVSGQLTYSIYSLIKEIRNKSLTELYDILQGKLLELNQSWNILDTCRLNGKNYKTIKYLLSRISGFIDTHTGIPTNFGSYHNSNKSNTNKPFEIEHIWSNNFEDYSNNCIDQVDFDEYRNRLGALLLLPRGSNQSYGDMPYNVKINHYIKENLLVQSLCSLTYDNNPNFKSMINKFELPFKPHVTFTKIDIETRQQLYKQICEIIWYFNIDEFTQDHYIPVKPPQRVLTLSEQFFN